MESLRRIARLTETDRPALLWASLAAVALIAFADYVVKPNVSLGYLYMLPILLSAGFLSPWQIVLFSTGCTLLREYLGPFDGDGFVWTRDAFVFFSFTCSGLLTRQAIIGRRRSEEHSRRLEAEVELRRDAEEQLRILVESNPAAIFTVDADCRILLANRSAGRLLGVPHRELPGVSLADYLPDLGRVPIVSERRFFRTNMECLGRREDGSLLAVDVWFSTYDTSKGRRLTAIVLDSTEETREREGLGLDSLLDNSRVLVGAVLHEIRNLSAAASVACQNLRGGRLWLESEDIRALGSLVDGLEKVASSELAPLAGRENASADFDSVLRDFQLVVEPTLAESGARLLLSVQPGMRVRIDRHSLLQLLLNLFRNSVHAMQNSRERVIRVSVMVDGRDAALRFQDSGPGVGRPEQLFQAFRSSSEEAGLGLYVSRAIVRSFGGDLEYEPALRGASFVVRLRRQGRIGEPHDDDHNSVNDQRADHRRPQSVPPGAGAAARVAGEFPHPGGLRQSR